ncbi:MAG: hypothetical protein GX860_03860, partial [Alcaligenaceae bacterium]|nr:hypothetical protein [Alcaligenaceae bacterium]
MNKIYKSIWNEQTGTYVAVSENTKGRGKRSSAKKIAMAGVVLAIVGLSGVATAATQRQLEDLIEFGDWYTSNAAATGTRSLAIGSGADASGYESVAIGLRAIADGGTASQSVAIGAYAEATGGAGVALGANAEASGSLGVALGGNAKALGSYSTALGVGSKASEAGAVALGQSAYATAKNSVALGHRSKALGENSVALGQWSNASGKDSMAFGSSSSASAADSIAVGRSSRALAADSIAVGRGAIAGQSGNVALGNGSITGAQHTGDFAINNLSVAGLTSGAKTVSVGSVGAERQIQNVAPGVVDAYSTDAINGSQLFATNSKITDIGDQVDNNTTIITDLADSPLSFTGDTGSTERKLGESLEVVGGNGNITTAVTDGKLAINLANDLNLTSVTTGNTSMDTSGVTITGGAGGVVSLTDTGLTAGSVAISSTTGINAGGKKISNVADGAVNSDAVNLGQLKTVAGNLDELSNLAVVYDSTNKDSITLAGANGTTITNLKDGLIAADSKDAVNGGQIHNMGQSIADGMGGTSTFTDGKLVTELNVAGNPYYSVNDALTGVHDDLSEQITSVENIANQGWNVKSNDGNSFANIGPDGDVNFEGDDNITIVQTGGDNNAKLQVTLKEDIKVDSVNAGGTLINNNGLSFVDASGVLRPNTVFIKPDGIDMGGNKITNVAPGT